MTDIRLFPRFRYVNLVLLAMSLFCSAKIQAQATPASNQTVPQITGNIDASKLVVLKGNVHPLATAANDTGIAAGDLPLRRMMLVLKRSDVQQGALKKILADQQNPSMPGYHKWLTPSGFGTQFGAAEADIQKIASWLESYGFTIESVSPGQNFITFSGTHAQLQAAFHTEIHSYKVNGSKYWANAYDPQIPVALAPVVAGFASLNNFPRKALHTSPRLIKKDASSKKWISLPGAAKMAPAFTTTDNQGNALYVISPYDFATIYNVQPLWNSGIDGTGQTIAIVSDSDINPADIDYFRSTFGLPAKKLNILYSSENPGTNEDEGEADLDVEWAGAVAKNATIDLVVGADTNISSGVSEALAYIINNNLASLMSVSYGACELALGTSGNQYFNEAWQQAAAQGITVMVASGDAGSAACDQGFAYVSDGLEVNGFASTPYTVSVGGTDFYASFNSPSTYWNTTNDPNTLASALSYIPETTWNDSCANPDVLAVLQNNGLTDSGPEALCNDPNEQQFFISTVAGGGGKSKCISSDGQNSTTCQNGHPKPEWQTGVPGITADGVRDLPDISLMSGNGLWGSFYVYCQSDASPGGSCDVNSALEGAGGTSFATPAFAGIMALVQQKTHSQQGNANYVLYKLAALQYSDGSLTNPCQSGNVTAGNACTFYDITDGTIALPCLDGSADCSAAIIGDEFGILPGYDAAQGYDLATGLGSVNAYNLVENWSNAATTFLPTSVALTASSSTSFTYGSNLNLSVSVAAKPPATGTPSGDIAITSNSSTLNALSVTAATLANGQASLQVGELPVGTYDLYARYAGDSTYAPSKSSGVAITVSPAMPSTSLAASKTTLAGDPNTTTLRMTVTGTVSGAAPTGTITFTDLTTGSVLGTSALAQSITTVNASDARITVATNQLTPGANNISATYSGDSDYSSVSAAPVAVTVTSAFTVAINPAGMVISSTSGSGNSALVTVTPVIGTGTPATLSFSCPANLPTGLSCVFGPATPNANGTVSSQLTVKLGGPLLASTSSQQQSAFTAHALQAGAFTGLASLIFLGFPLRRRRLPLFLGMLILSASCFIIGCGGGSSHNGSGNGEGEGPSPTATITTLNVSSATPALSGPLTLSAEVAPGKGSGTPTGSVSFVDGTNNLGSGDLTNGKASLTTTALSIGVHSITAQYKGDSNYSVSTSSPSGVDVTFNTQFTIAASDSLGNTSSANLTVTVQ